MHNHAIVARVCAPEREGQVGIGFEGAEKVRSKIRHARDRAHLAAKNPADQRRRQLNVVSVVRKNAFDVMAVPCSNPFVRDSGGVVVSQSGIRNVIGIYCGLACRKKLPCARGLVQRGWRNRDCSNISVPELAGDAAPRERGLASLRSHGHDRGSGNGMPGFTSTL